MNDDIAALADFFDLRGKVESYVAGLLVDEAGFKESQIFKSFSPDPLEPAHYIQIQFEPGSARGDEAGTGASWRPRADGVQEYLTYEGTLTFHIVTSRLQNEEGERDVTFSGKNVEPYQFSTRIEAIIRALMVRQLQMFSTAKMDNGIIVMDIVPQEGNNFSDTDKGLDERILPFRFLYSLAVDKWPL